MAYVNLAGGVAEQRSRLTLKRLRGTPLPPWAYIAGRLGAALLLGLATVAGVLIIGVLVFSVSLPPGVWLPSVAAFVLGIVCFTSLGLLISSMVGSPQAVIALALATLLPLSFVSDIFVAGVEFPPVMNAIGWTFPLRHVVAAAVTATSGGSIDGAWWLHIAVIAGWACVAAAGAWLFFRWEPRR
jgi:ABC-type multidrug transport system permease subunit